MYGGKGEQKWKLSMPPGGMKTLLTGDDDCAKA